MKAVSGMLSYLGYLGPEGTFSEEAALAYLSQAKLPLSPQAFPTCQDIVAAVATGKLTAGILPWENSLAGPVYSSLDLLLETDACFITAEVVVPVSHCLLARFNTQPAKITSVYSHPQALNQCQRFLHRFLPQATRIPTASTAAAAAMVASNPEAVAAIGPTCAAKRYGLKIVYEAIQDSINNWTRFVVIAKEDNSPRNNAKTALILAPPSYQAAALPACLYTLTKHGVALLSLETRPARRQLGEYFFFLELDGDRNSPPLAQALGQLKNQVKYLRILGSYPRAV